MKVKIGNVIYNSDYEPVLLILEEHEKDSIAKMKESDTKFCSFPDDYDVEKVKEFMNEEHLYIERKCPITGNMTTCTHDDCTTNRTDNSCKFVGENLTYNL